MHVVPSVSPWASEWKAPVPWGMRQLPATANLGAVSYGGRGEGLREQCRVLATWRLASSALSVLTHLHVEGDEQQKQSCVAKSHLRCRHPSVCNPTVARLFASRRLLLGSLQKSELRSLWRSGARARVTGLAEIFFTTFLGSITPH